MHFRVQALLAGTAIATAVVMSGFIAGHQASAEAITAEQRAALVEALAVGNVQTALAGLPESVRTDVTQALSNSPSTEVLANRIADIVSQNAAIAQQVQTAVAAVVSAPVQAPAFRAVTESIRVDVSQSLQQRNIQTVSNLQPTGVNVSNIQPAAGQPGPVSQGPSVQPRANAPKIVSSPGQPGGGSIQSVSVLAPPPAAQGQVASNGQ